MKISFRSLNRLTFWMYVLAAWNMFKCAKVGGLKLPHATMTTLLVPSTDVASSFSTGNKYPAPSIDDSSVRCPRTFHQSNMRDYVIECVSEETGDTISLSNTGYQISDSASVTVNNCIIPYSGSIRSRLGKPIFDSYWVQLPSDNRDTWMDGSSAWKFWRWNVHKERDHMA